MKYEKPLSRWPIYPSPEAVVESLSPKGNVVVIKRQRPEEERNGIALANQPKAHYGEVLAIGPGKKTKSGRGPMEFKVGDTVLLGHYDDYPKLTTGDDVIVVREGDILAVVDGC